MSSSSADMRLKSLSERQFFNKNITKHNKKEGIMERIRFKKEKETKNTVRYIEETDGKPPIIGTLYVQKWFLGKTPPETITVTIEKE